MICKACSCSCMTSKSVASGVYFLILFLFVVTALFFKYDGGDIVIGGTYNATAEASIIDKAASMAGRNALHYWNDRFYCAPSHPDAIAIICCARTCSGVYAVYRFSFVLCLFFSAITVCTVGNTRFGARAHRGFWFLKLFVLFGLLISAIFVDNSAMAAYREFARYASFLFLLWQIVALIDFGYQSNDYLLKKHEESESESWCNFRTAILAGAFMLYASSITMWALQGHFFGGDGFGPQQALLALTIILTVFLSTMSCTKYCPHGTLLTSSLVTAYASYLCYSAFLSHPDSRCNPWSQRKQSSIPDLLVNFFFWGISMASTAWSATNAASKALVGNSNVELSTALDGGTASSSSAPDDEGKVEAESWWHYHLVMVMSSFFMAMVLSDWSEQPVNALPDGAHNTSLDSFWVKIASQWVCLFVYAWTLLAPYLLRNVRDFGVEFDFD